MAVTMATSAECRFACRRTLKQPKWYSPKVDSLVKLMRDVVSLQRLDLLDKNGTYMLSRSCNTARLVSFPVTHAVCSSARMCAFVRSAM